MGLFGAGDPPCPAGSICSKQARTFVGRKTAPGAMGSTNVTDPGTGIYHSSATKLNSDGSSTTDVYIIKDNKWQKAATTTDGGKTYTFDDDVAGAGLKNELNDPKGGIHKNIDAGVNKAADNAGVPPTTKAKLLDSNKNKAENDNDADNSSKPIASSAQNNAAAKGTRNKFGNLKYPLTIGNTDMDVIKFSMLEFSPKKFSKKGGLGALDDRAKGRNAIGTVTLPIPGAITDQNNADWGDGRLNPLQAAGLQVASDALTNGLAAGASSASASIGKVPGTAGQAKQTLAGVIAASAVGISADEVLARTQGAVVNPNLELLFKGPSLRPFNFSFQMGARNEGESDEIMKILRFFKQGGSPQRTQAQYLVKAPHTFQIEYLHRGENGQQNKYLNKIKECALLSVGVNYTPNNNYATFKNGAPVAVELTLSFKELDPVFNDEYGDGDGDVGF